MKVLHINSYYSGSKFYKNLYHEQIINGLDIEVYVPVSKGFKTDGFNFGQYTTLSENHGKYDRLLFHHKHYKIFNDIINNYDLKSIKLIHAHSLFSNGYIALKLKEKYGVPYIVAVRNTDVNIFFKKMLHLRKLGIEILRQAENVIFISEPYQKLVVKKYLPEDLRENIISKSHIIPNGVDDFWFNHIRKDPKKMDNKKINLLYVGAIDKNKNIMTTISAIENIIQRGYSVEFTVVGRIKDKKIFQKLESMPFVKYLGEMNKDELLGIYRKNDIFVMPSINETFGLVYAEAMTQGLPLIYTSGQGFDGQFENSKVGFSVNPLNVDEISEKIIEILKYFERMSLNCIELSSRFRWKQINEQYMSVYNLTKNC